jgi:CRP-like cAMP-binding protein
MSDPKPTLPTFSWLGHLKEDDRDLLSSYGEFFPGHPGNIIIEEGVLQTEVFVVISGELEVYTETEDGTSIVRARVGPGETIGEMSLFDPAPATATVRATEFSQLWRIADTDLIQFMDQNPGAGNVLLRTLATILAQRLRQVDPEAFGLSAYAVVESPELTEREAIVHETSDAPGGTVPRVRKVSTGTQVIPDPDDLEAYRTPEVPLEETSPAGPGSAAPRGTKVSTGTQVIPDPDDLEAFRDPEPTVDEAAPAGPGSNAPHGRRVSTGTQVLPDPDDLGAIEPL